MNKDEMKNRISFALKDPILQQGFECICKENAELKEKSSRQSKNYKCDVDKLLEENAELKSGCGMCYRKDKEQLTKATEIIKKLYPFVRDKCYTTTLSENKERQSLIAEAEQFISEVKK